MAEDFEGLNFDEQLNLWSKIASIKMVKALSRYKIGRSGALQKSIEGEIKKAGGDVSVAMFRFLKYGRFVDIGTGGGRYGGGFARGGKGTQAFALYRNDNGSLKKTPGRKPKPWYSKTMYREIKILSEKLLADMSDQAMETLKARMRRINTHSSNAPK